MKERSFSLIEVVIAIAILYLILTGMLEIFSQGFHIGEESRKRTIAYNLAKEKLEEQSFSPTEGESNENYGQIPGFPEFRRFTSVYDFIVGWQLQLIFVKIYWNNDTRSQSFTTLITTY